MYEARAGACVVTPAASVRLAAHPLAERGSRPSAGCCQGQAGLPCCRGRRPCSASESLALNPGRVLATSVLILLTSSPGSTKTLTSSSLSRGALHAVPRRPRTSSGNGRSVSFPTPVGPGPVADPRIVCLLSIRRSSSGCCSCRCVWRTPTRHPAPRRPGMTAASARQFLT